MSLLDLASRASAIRGYDYYTEKKVLSLIQICESEYDGTVYGSENKIYNVHIDMLHPKKSSCNCLFSEGKRKICKHKVALFFAANPDIADVFNERNSRIGKGDEDLSDLIFDLIHQKIDRMSKDELQDALWQFVLDSPIWVQKDFVSDLIDPDMDSLNSFRY